MGSEFLSKSASAPDAGGAGKRTMRPGGLIKLPSDVRYILWGE